MRLLQHTRAALRLPSQGTTSTVFPIDKKKGKSGIEGLRLLHCFCPLWRCILRSMLLRGSEYTDARVPRGHTEAYRGGGEKDA